MGSGPRGQVPWPTRFYTLSCCLTQHFQQRNSSVYRTTCGKIYMFFRIRDFTQTDGMRTIGGRDHYRETRTHSAELSPNFV